MSKFRQAWAGIFEQLGVVDHVNNYGFLDVSAKTLKAISGEEPRLLAKMDNRNKQPLVMRDSNISLLAIKNGKYRFTKENPFISIPDISNMRVYPIKKMEGLLTLDKFSNEKKTETMALDLAHYNSVLDDCFGEKVSLTLRNKRRASFKFKLGKMDFDVDKVQIEIDGCYEGARGIHIVEAKNSDEKDATIRQLLYAKKMITEVIRGEKPVYAWLMVYDKETGIFNFHKFLEGSNRYYFDVNQSKRYVLK